MEALFWSALGLIGGGIVSMVEDPTPRRKAVAVALLMAGFITGLVYMVYEPL